MTIIQRPSENPFASQALAGEVQNYAEWARGWGFLFDPGQTGGIPPVEFFNDVLANISKASIYFLQEGIPAWSTTMEYPVDAMVKRGGELYRCLVQNTNTDPAVNTTNWSSIFNKLVTKARPYAPGQIITVLDTSPPTGSLLVDGAICRQGEYPLLYAKIGHKYKTSVYDEAVFFQLPIWREGDAILGTITPASVGQKTVGSVISHDHTASSASAGSHGHNGSASSAGGHSHSAGASNAGTHNHNNGGYNQLMRPPYGGSLTGNDRTGSGSELPVGPGDAAIIVDSGLHTHDISIGAAGTHSHDLSIQTAGAHSHGVTVNQTGGSVNSAAGLRVLVCIGY